MLEAVDNAAKDNLYNATQNSVEKRIPIPGWSEEVKPFQETVFFHYLIINPMLARIGIDYPRALYNYYCVLFLCNEYLLPLGKEDKKLAQNLGSVTYLTKVLSCHFI